MTLDILLKNTVLYKVGHHGSHNATLKDDGLEKMTHPDLVAMIPEKEGSYNGIPYGPLMKRLMQRCNGRVLVSADANFPPENLLQDHAKPSTLTAGEWAVFLDNLRVEKPYVEYTVK